MEVDPICLDCNTLYSSKNVVQYNCTTPNPRRPSRLFQLHHSVSTPKYGRNRTLRVRVRSKHDLSLRCRDSFPLSEDDHHHRQRNAALGKPQISMLLRSNTTGCTSWRLVILLSLLHGNKNGLCFNNFAEATFGMTQPSLLPWLTTRTLSLRKRVL